MSRTCVSMYTASAWASSSLVTPRSLSLHAARRRRFWSSRSWLSWMRARSALISAARASNRDSFASSTTNRAWESRATLVLSTSITLHCSTRRMICFTDRSCTGAIKRQVSTAQHWSTNAAAARDPADGRA